MKKWKERFRTRKKVVIFIGRRREVEMCGWLAGLVNFPSYKEHVGQDEIWSYVAR